MTRFQKVFLSAGLALAAIPSHAQSTAWVLDPNHTQAAFVVKHMSITNVRGAISNAKGTVLWDPKDVTKCKIEVVFDATTINTQSAYRDKDIKGADWFNVEKFPTLKFQSSSVEKTAKGLRIHGDLTLAGVTKPVVLEASEPTPPQKGMQGGLVSAVEASTTIYRSEFNFGSKYPSAMVSDEIQITLDVEMDQK